MKSKKKQIVFFSLKDKNSDFAFWKTKTPEERIAALEYLRNLYLTDSNGNRQRLQKTFSFTDKKTSGRLKDLNDLENLK
ncbi:MAG: hypothetical protein FVQ77_06400 [Cytophagales bacterium]|nr:hypothetical protein [Cytophagales bacterium]